MPPNPAKRQKQSSEQRMVVQHHSGPLPSPVILSQYEAIVPGAAAGIFEDFHKNSDHIRKMNENVVNGSVSRDVRSQWMAYSLVIGMTCAGIACAALISIPLGIAIIVTSMPVTIGAFLHRKPRK
jgi:uncharacterized membrane protein